MFSNMWYHISNPSCTPNAKEYEMKLPMFDTDLYQGHIDLHTFD
jgi:hypothetical protein